MKLIHLTPTALAVAQFGTLAVGMASWLDEDEDDGGSGQPEGDDEFGMDEEFDDDFDDEFGSFDGMDDGGGGADSSVNELESRIEELETEVSNVSSKANTVRSENEQISESVDDVEENVRKLLEIYEMVTRGVNPFVDDVEGAGGVGGGGGAESFGLFDDEEGDEDEEEELDADIADADANDFFDDDAFDEGEELDDGEFGEDEFGDDELGGEFDEMDDGEMDDGEMDADEDDVDDESGGGTSFEELKEEYESGDAEWAEGDDVEDGIEAEEKDDIGFDDSDLEADAETETASDDTGEFEFDEDDVTTDAGEESPDDGPSAPALGLRSQSDGPHLAEPPTGYLADVVSLEFLEYLLSEFGPKNTVRTLNYYERIGWIGEPVRDHLFDLLEGLTDSDYLYREEFGTTQLTMDDHLESLEYIEELASGDIERSIIDRCEDLQRNGIQR
ncbi:FlaD/FlaE family flagellar protein [Halobacterium zhouii]|uniref:FlaD/FlaE family flagellar protein n=1 Tax=Halobacterium zhouii TaxID=2902624 RepID=UPI001E52E70B|nr:FlaD/FlaE family flagellar protein [Halobacterium zhouii]